MTTSYKVSVIIVSYLSASSIGRCASSATRCLQNTAYEVIIINNGGEDLSFLGSGVRIVSPAGGNIGFGAAANLATSVATGEILWFLNPDAEAISSDMCAVEREFSARDVAAVGARLVDVNGSTLPWSAGVDTGLVDIVRNNLGFPQSRSIWESKNARTADWVSGASLFARADAFRAIGGFDEQFFLYFEDADLCKRLRAAGHRVRYVPNFTVRHTGGASFRRDRVLQKKQYYESQDEYLRKHRGAPSAFIVKMVRNLLT